MRSNWHVYKPAMMFGSARRWVLQAEWCGTIITLTKGNGRVRRFLTRAAAQKWIDRKSR
jgi:hypothetical protein